MYKIAILLVVAFTSLISSDIHWEKDFKSAINHASSLNKPVMFIFSRHTCKYCVMLEKEALSDKRIITALNRDFVSVISYTDENDYTPRELWRPGTPTIWFLNPNGEPMFQPIAGAIGADDFVQAVAIVKNEFDKKSKTVSK